MFKGLQNNTRAYSLIPAIALSRLGSIAYTVVVSWYISQSAGNSVLGIMNALSGAGVICASIIGFLIIDKYNKKFLLIFYDLISIFLCILALFLISIYNNGITYILLTLSTWLSLVAAIYGPTSRAIIPEILDNDDFKGYNSVYSVVGELSRSIGPFIGTLVLSQHSFEALKLSLFINAVSFLLSLGITFYIPIKLKLPISKSSKTSKQIGSAESTFRNSFLYVFKSSYIRKELIYVTVINIWGSSTLYLLLTRISDLGLDSITYGLGVFIASLGAVIFSYLLNKFPSGVVEKYVSSRNILILVCASFTISIIPGIWGVMLALFFISGFVIIYNIKLFSDVQEVCNKTYIGKVMVILTLVGSIFTALGNLIFSKCSTVFDSTAYAVICSGSLLSIVVIILYWGLRGKVQSVNKNSI